MVTIKFRFQAFNRIFVTAFDWKKQEQQIFGWTNKVMGIGYIVTLDYDNIELFWIEEELKELQELFHLSNFYIFKTNKGYHAICFDKVPLMYYVNIIKNSSIDPNYAQVPLKYGKRLWTLRYSKKDGISPEYIKTIQSEKCKWEKSKAHIDYIEYRYPKLKGEIERISQDNSSKLIESEYKV